MKLAMFSKHLQSLPLAEAATRVREIGFEGLDLTVRPGGFVDPTQVRTALPEAQRMIRDAGLTVPLITTAITGAGDPAAVATFETAAKCEIREIKLGYVKYAAFGTFRETVDQMARDLEQIEK